MSLKFAVVGTILSSCATATVATPTTPPDLLGFVSVTAIAPNDPASGQLQVESHADKLVRRWDVTVNEDTIVVRETAHGNDSATLTAVRPQAWVRVWLSSQRPRPIARYVLIVLRP